MKWQIQPCRLRSYRKEWCNARPCWYLKSDHAFIGAKNIGDVPLSRYCEYFSMSARVEWALPGHGRIHKHEIPYVGGLFRLLTKGGAGIGERIANGRQCWSEGT